MDNLIKSLSLCTFIFSVITACSQNNKTTEKTTAKCPTQPKIVLESNNVKAISFSTQPITQSGMVSSNKSLGYTFKATSGQKLSYATNQDICIWIYTPDNQILTTRDLPTTGKYTIQVSAPGGSTTFDLAVNLESVAAASTLLSSPTPTSPASNNIWKNSTLASSSFSSRIPTSPVSTNIVRPSPEKIIEDYYTKVNSHQYQDAWNILSTALQENKQVHPDGYISFIEWWHKVKSVDINKSTLAEANSNSAIVNVWANYHMNNGRKVLIPLKFYIGWNDTNSKWNVIKVEKN